MSVLVETEDVVVDLEGGVKASNAVVIEAILASIF